MLLIKIISLVLWVVMLSFCDKKAEDLASSTSKTSTDDEEDKTSSTAAAGSLALAFPSDLNLSSSMEADSSGTGLKLGSDEEIAVSDEVLTPTERKEIIEDILTSTKIENCFQLVFQEIPQPGCFSANLSRDTWSASSSTYVVHMPSGITRLLYGDGGVLKKDEADGTACSAAASNYFTQDAISYVEVGKQLFASMVCASKFLNMELPTVSGTASVDYKSKLNEVSSDIKFEVAKISAEKGDDGDVYTTELLASYKVDSSKRKTYSYFRHQPDTNRGHVVVMISGSPNSLNEANASLLLDGQMPPPPGGGNPPQGGNQMQPPPSGQPQAGGAQVGNVSESSSSSGVTAVVSVNYIQTEKAMQVQLNRANFQSLTSSKHPVNFIKADGTFDRKAISDLDGSHGVADNFFSTRFVNFSDRKENLTFAKGIIGWTASLSDGSWRAFSYKVKEDASGNQMAESTFGYENMSAQYGEPGAPKGFFCSWAQGGSENSSSNVFLESAGPSGQGSNFVQYQVATRTAITSVFEHDDIESKMKYVVGQSDCGSSSDPTHFDMATVNSQDGAIDGFTPPTESELSVVGSYLGGVEMSSSSVVDLDVE